MTLKKIFTSYSVKKLNGLWIHYEHIRDLIDSLPLTLFKKEIYDYSENGVPIHLISTGSGNKTLLLWAQMHGDESTATKVLFDVFSYIQAAHLTDKKLINLLNTYTLVFVPMLNPDGALAYTRVNADGIDLNRDALALQTKGGQVLNKLIQTLKPSYAFNLHDQDSFYNVSGTDQVATFSFLAPAADVTKQLTIGRKKAMSIIYAMFQTLQSKIPNHVGRYNDTYCDNCFGDQIQKSGIPTILIESGHYPKDENREKTREFHFIALLDALFRISENDLPDYKGYFTIPNNEKLFYDIRYDNIVYKGKNTSVAIRYNDFVRNGKLKKVILKDQIIYGNQLKGKLFHKVIDAKGADFLNITLE